MKADNMPTSPSTLTPLVCPKPSRLLKAYSLNRVAPDVPTLRKSATAPLTADEYSANLSDPTNSVANSQITTDGNTDFGNENADALSSPAVEPEDLALTELLEIVSNRPPFHSLSKMAMSTPAYAEYPAIPRHHSSFEPRRFPKRGHSHSYSHGHITYAWSANTDELEWARNDDTPNSHNTALTPPADDEEEDNSEVLDVLIADLHVARTPSMNTAISASPIPRTQNPMPCNSPFACIPDDSVQGSSAILTMAPERYLSTGSTLVQSLLARQKALNTNTAAGRRFVGVY